MLRSFAAVALVAAAALPSQALQAARAQVVAEQSVLAESVTRDAQGRETVTFAPATRVAPGDRLAYVLTYENEGGAPAEGLVLTMPVPESVALLEAAPSGVAPDYSVDGGKSWGDLDDLTVLEDGAPRPALPGDVTHLRWRLAEAVEPGAVGEVRYRGVLR